MGIFVYPYHKGSKSAKALAQAIGGKRIKLENSKFKDTVNKYVINWGSTSMPEYKKATCLNDPRQVAVAKNKLKTFRALENYGVSVPTFTTNKDEVVNWDWKGKSPIIFARETLTGHSGQGITVLESAEDWDNYDHDKAKLYTKFVRHGVEFRVHVAFGEVFFVQRKCLRTDELRPKNPNFKIRNHDSGFIFAHQIDKVQENIDDDIYYNIYNTGRKAVEALGLDFGAVDISYSRDDKKVYVLEVNTAPGLEGTTLEKYAGLFKGDYG